MEHSSFLGTQPGEAEVETESPEIAAPSGEEVETATDTTQPEKEEVAEGETAQAEPDAELQKLLVKKGISHDKFSEYRERYGISEELIKANPSLKHLVFDKIATDEVVNKKTEPPKEEVKQDPPANLEEHFKSLSEQVKQYSDPKVVAHFASQLQAAAEKGDVAGQLNILQAAMHNYLTTVLPTLVPKIQEEHQTVQTKASQENFNVHSNLWAGMRSENPELPEDLKGAYEEAVKVMPLLAQPMDPQQRLNAIAALVGNKTKTAEVAAQAADAGRRTATAAAKTAALGKGLGAGKSNGNIAPAKKTSPMQEGYEMYKGRETNNF